MACGLGVVSYGSMLWLVGIPCPILLGFTVYEEMREEQGRHVDAYVRADFFGVFSHSYKEDVDSSVQGRNNTSCVHLSFSQRRGNKIGVVTHALDSVGAERHVGKV